MLSKPTVPGHRFFIVFLSAILWVIGNSASKLQSAEKPARYSPALEKVIEGAKKEGALKIQWLPARLGGEVGLRPMVEAMNRTYGTNIKLRFTPGPDFNIMLNKIIQEKAAGAPASSDVNLMSANQASQGENSGMLRKMDWESILERPAPPDANVSRLAPKGASVIVASRVVGITYNSNLVKGSDIPDSMEDVFNPKWKGKIVSATGAPGLYQFAAKDMLGYDHMKGYTQRLGKHIGGLTSCSNVERISSGEFAMMVFDCGHDDAVRYQKRGAPLGHAIVREITRINLMYVGVPLNAENPNAATLFINFLHTPEGQVLQWQHSSQDFHIYPEAYTRNLVQRVISARGKLVLDTVEREQSLGHEEVSRIRDEFVKILMEGSR